MAFIVSRQPNAGYSGIHRAEATRLVKSGVRVGCVVIDQDSKTFFCHVHGADAPRPAETMNPGKIDHLGECPVCKTPFIFWSF